MRTPEGRQPFRQIKAGRATIHGRRISLHRNVFVLSPHETKQYDEDERIATDLANAGGRLQAGR